MRAIWDVPSKRTWSWCFENPSQAATWEICFYPCEFGAFADQIKNCYGEESKGVCVCVCVCVCEVLGCVPALLCQECERFPVGSGRRKWRERLDVWTDRRVSKWNACLGEWKGDGSLLDSLWQSEERESTVFTDCWESSWTQWALLFRWAMEVRRKSCNWGNRKETTINPVGLTRNGFHGFPIEGLNGGFPARSGYSEPLNCRLLFVTVWSSMCAW